MCVDDGQRFSKVYACGEGVQKSDQMWFLDGVFGGESRSVSTERQMEGADPRVMDDQTTRPRGSREQRARMSSSSFIDAA